MHTFSNLLDSLNVQSSRHVEDSAWSGPWGLKAEVSYVLKFEVFFQVKMSLTSQKFPGVFEGTYCHHLLYTSVLKMEAVWSTEMFINTYVSRQSHNQENYGKI